MIDELVQLVTVERPKVVREVSDAAAEGDRSENAAYIYGKRRLREIDRRAGFLQRRLELVEVVDGRKQSRARVFFGAVVGCEDEDGEPITYQVVGVDEVDAKAGRISWQSPIGKALLGKQVGDSVRVTWHAGERELSVESIRYLDDPPPGETSRDVLARLQDGRTVDRTVDRSGTAKLDASPWRTPSAAKKQKGGRKRG